jgi:tetratricopeptide (TPR) repeat protein
VTASPRTSSPAPEIALDLARLTDALRIAEGGFIAFALIDDYSALEAMMREIETRLAGEIAIHRIRLTPEQPYLYERLVSSVTAQLPLSNAEGNRRAACFAYGFESLSDEARRQAFGALQIQREAIGRLEVPVVLWMVEGNLSDLARCAPDFFAWRAGLYDFRPLDRDRKQAEAFGRAVEHMLGIHAPSLIPPAELRKRTRLFEAMLARLQAEAEPPFERMAALHLDLGNIHHQLNEWDAALDHYQRARATYERLGDTAGVAQTLNNIGAVLRHKGEWDAALDHYQRARATYERLGDTAGVAQTLWNMGLLYDKQGRIEEAFPLLERAIEIERRLGHPDAEKDAAYVERLRGKVSTDEKRING